MDNNKIDPESNFSINLEKLLDEKIGFGVAQYRQISPLAIINLC